ncbi:MAG TPA: hypothetical protein VIW29_10595 [Polyangiaceae bacterium]
MSDQAQTDAAEPEESAREAADAPEAARPESKPLLNARLLGTLRWAVPLAWLLAVFAAGYVFGVELAFLVLAAGVLVLVITMLWWSVQSLTGSSSLGFEEALGMGAPSRVEEEKRSVLRALKDLEYERSVGKISPEDYAELSTKYRTEAKRLIQSLDAALEPARREVELALDARLQREGISLEPEATSDEPLPASDEPLPASDESDEPAPDSAAGKLAKEDR